MKNQIKIYNEVLKKYPSIEVKFKKLHRGYDAIMTHNNQSLNGWLLRGRSKTDIKEIINFRYLAECHKNSAYIATRCTMKNPKFNNRYGGLPEIAENILKPFKP